MAKARVAILISGKGSNMAALLYAAKDAACPYEVVLVASNNPKAEGLALAAAEHVATFKQSHKGLTREAHDALMQAAIANARADYVLLAGYMRILTDGFVASWQSRMLNIHPSLLPKYRGLDTYQRALDAGDAVVGCSVHVVTPALDDGPVLGQIEVAVLPGDTAKSLAERVRIAEHQLYPRILATYIRRESDPDWLIGRVRALASQQPAADEVTSHGMACFGIIGGKKFAYVAANHHGDGKTALLVKISGADEQVALIEADPNRYYRPAYFGDGWVAMRIDLGDVDWDDIGDWLAKSWRAVAPKKLTRLMDVAGDF